MPKREEEMHKGILSMFSRCVCVLFFCLGSELPVLERFTPFQIKPVTGCGRPIFTYLAVKDCVFETWEIYTNYQPSTKKYIKKKIGKNSITLMDCHGVWFFSYNLIQCENTHTKKNIKKNIDGQ